MSKAGLRRYPDSDALPDLTNDQLRQFDELAHYQ
jgi:hypothetical protein